jgi:hypothetical protein
MSVCDGRANAGYSSSRAHRDGIFSDLRQAGGRLTDAHRAVGVGLGSSWRPAFLMQRCPRGLIRIGYQLSSPGLRPLRITTDCTPRGSDHCLLAAVFDL